MSNEVAKFLEARDFLLNTQNYDEAYNGFGKKSNLVEIISERHLIN
jgi:hypothetical protein